MKWKLTFDFICEYCVCDGCTWVYVCMSSFSLSFISYGTYATASCAFHFRGFQIMYTTHVNNYYMAENMSICNIFRVVLFSVPSLLSACLPACQPVGQYIMLIYLLIYIYVICQFIWLFLYFDRIVAKAAAMCVHTVHCTNTFMYWKKIYYRSISGFIIIYV